MTTPKQLLQRLDDIAQSLKESGHGRMLIGLGSVGFEHERLDEYSDLDFFAVVEEGWKGSFIVDLAWLNRASRVAWSFQNTADGYKLLFEDGIYAEFAVFEPQELAHIPFKAGRVVWAAEGVDHQLAVPVMPLPVREERSTEYLLGEALSNLYVGLGRFRRGEKLSAFRYIQGYAVDRVLELAGRMEPAQVVSNDEFTLERRCEARFPELARALPALMPGYEAAPQAARQILALLEAHFTVDAVIKARIEELM
ncbi:MAG TPA: hypothetical protein PKW33_02665 [Anaerolineaceae bacterium]|nr:hypothetical protein [Anaerolineaceae bacterium]HPN50464.1 hypothetical protein [Anaerolineaceae bacterium]